MKTFKLVLLVLLTSFGIQAQELVSGKATLTKVKEGIFEIKIEGGPIKEIDIRPNVEEHLQGTLAVLFKDCEEIRQSVFDLKFITETDLINTVQQYNTCNYTPFEPTENEVERAENFQEDKYRFFASIGASMNRISFFNLDDYENLAQGQLSFGLAATPGFLGSLQENLYFTLEASAAFSGDKDFGNSPFATNFNKNSFRTNLGTEFHFNKKGSINPLIGIGIGLVRDHYDGNYNDFKINQTEGSVYWTPKAGVLFKLDNKKSLGVIVSYIPEYENDLSFLANDEIVPLIIDTYYINAGLYFYF
ncbi:hypothetical protein QRD02_08370 [Aequorivita sp. SDUM287046]|uniref:Outer membrane protein beta-barrel domain-containing protein n=1 Tax=Aequorivita aurantiaca TaxID=3053356 RepID=A0ABT8DGA0_9FLAO|nr:hypothetical protein [Aequorivita aurantiaca]MDN3724395.1 hypothetical protein [Aequorivita aurantiaca]